MFMDKTDREIIDKAKRYLKSHKLEFILMGLGAISGAAIGYYWWLIDFI